MSGMDLNTLMAMNSTATASNSSGVPNPFQAPVVDLGTRNVELTQGGAAVAQGTSAMDMSAIDKQNAMAAMMGKNPMGMGAMGMQMLNKPQQQAQAPGLTRGKVIDGDIVGTLLAPKQKKKEQFSLL